MSQGSKKESPERLVWLDLEMTGLDEKTCHIIQAAVVITDFDLNVLAKHEVTIWQPDSVISSMSPVVKKIHTENALIKRVRASDISIFEAEKELMDVLCQHVDYQKGLLAGNTVYVDRRFLRAYMPAFESYLHYRQVDISSIKVLCKAWYDKQSPKKESSHTALEDIEQSIEELKFLKTNCFIG